MYYTVMPDYLSEWGDNCTEDTVITVAELEDLSSEWEVPVETLLHQLIEHDTYISFDNGAHWMDADEAIESINDPESPINWETIVEYMDAETRERVHRELAPCSEIDFLTRYLDLAPADLIIG